MEGWNVSKLPLAIIGIRLSALTLQHVGEPELFIKVRSRLHAVRDMMPVVTAPDSSLGSLAIVR